MTAYREPKLSKALLEQLELGLFDHLIGHLKSPLLRPQQVATATGWALQTIYDLCDGGRLETHDLGPDRSTKRKLITRRSVAAFIAASANYEPRDFLALVTLILPTLGKTQLVELMARAQAELRSRPL